MSDHPDRVPADSEVAALAADLDIDHQLLWGETLALHQRTTVVIPVQDHDSTDFGEMVLPVDQARVLMAMLGDAVMEANAGTEASDLTDARPSHADLIDRIKGMASESAATNDRIMQALKADTIALSHEEPDGTGIRPTMSPYAESGVFDPAAGLKAGAEYIRERYAGTTTEPHTRAMAIAAGYDTDPGEGLDEFRLALGRGERWPLDRLTDDMVDVLYGEYEQQCRRNAGDQVWQRQADELAKQAQEIGDRDGKLRQVRCVIEDWFENGDVRPDSLTDTVLTVLDGTFDAESYFR